MSGGHFNYLGAHLRDDLQIMAGDEEVARRWPALAAALEALSEPLYDIEQEIDWDLEGDSKITEDSAFERAALWRLLKALVTNAPDAWFPRGKWATIQAIEARHDAGVAS